MSFLLSCPAQSVIGLIWILGLSKKYWQVQFAYIDRLERGNAGRKRATRSAGDASFGYLQMGMPVLSGGAEISENDRGHWR